MNKRTDLEIFDALHELLHLFKRKMLARLHEHHPQLNFVEMRVLMQCGRKPGITQKELVALSNLDKAQMTRTLANLEEAGWLARNTSEHDKRVRCLYLTAKGQALGQQLQQWHEAVAHEIFGDWPAEAAEVLKAAVASVRR